MIDLPTDNPEARVLYFRDIRLPDNSGYRETVAVEDFQAFAERHDFEFFELVGEE